MVKGASYVTAILTAILIITVLFFRMGATSITNEQSAGSEKQFSISTTFLDLGYLDTPYRTFLRSTGGEVPLMRQVITGTVPSGLTLESKLGEITGTPQTTGNFPLKLKATDPTGMLASRVSDLEIVNPTLDPYGGSIHMNCSSTTGYFHVEKIADRWWFCTPEGHVFWMVGVFAMSHDSHVTDLGTSYDEIAKSKYGDLNWKWGSQQVRRIKSWGFNSVAEFSSAYTLPIATCGGSGCPLDWRSNQGKQPVPVPMTAQVQPALYSLFNQNNYAPGAVKDVVFGVNLHNWMGYGSSFPDIYDPNFRLWLDGEMKKHPAVLPEENSPWVIAWITDECDELTGLCGAGPDFPTISPGHNQRSQGLVTLVTSPVQTLHPVGGPVRYFEVYSNTAVLSKEQLQEYLKKKYVSIAALNSAWGSAYSTFDSEGTQVRGEVLATGDGKQTTFASTLAHPRVSAYSVAFKVNGKLVAGDCPAWVAIQACSKAGAGNGELAVVPVASGLAIPQAGTIQYAKGTILISFALAPPKGTTISIDYVHDGWGYGNGLMDEDGRHNWIPRDSVHLGSNKLFNADMEGFLKNLASTYFSTVTSTIRKYDPHHLVFGPGVLGTWSAPADKNVLEAAAPYVDGIATTLDYTRAQEELSYTASHLGDKPMVVWLGTHANLDSALWRYKNWIDSPCDPCDTQAARAMFYTNAVNSFLKTTNTVYNDHTVIGFRWWALLDNWAEKANWGLITLEDNPYDGTSAVVARGTDPWGYTTGGEEKNYSSFLGPVRDANIMWLNIH